MPPTDRGTNKPRTHGSVALSRYVPSIAVAWDDVAPGRQWHEVDGTLCFVDISGFTSLSERLARRGRIGAEELTDILNRVFSAMLRTAYDYGGSLIKFGGDALLLLFRDDDHAIRAASAVTAMQHTLRSATSEPTAAGKIKLRMSVGVHSGTIQLFCVGTSHRELMITGPAGTMTTTMEHTAEAGEILVSPATRALLPTDAVSGQKGEGWLLKWRKPAVPPTGFAGRDQPGEVVMTRWMPTALRAFLSATTPEPEHRVATVGFVRFCGVDELIARSGPAVVAAGLQDMITIIQDAADAEDVTFLATDINEDGGKVILVAGAPSVHEDDEGRMLRAVRRIADAETLFDLHIGVNRGHVFSGEVGTDYRSTYTVMGDTVNVAARLCAAAWAHRIYATPDVLDRSHTLFATEPLEPLAVKGKAEPLTAYSVGEETGSREAATRTEVPFVGRTEERDTLRAVFAGEGEGGVRLVTVRGEAGLGKSRLVDAVLDELPERPRILVRAEPYGAANPYRPFRDPLRSLFGIERDTQPAMVAALAARVEEIDQGLLPLLPLIGDATHVDVPSTPEVDDIEPRFRRDRLADVMISLLDAVVDPDSVWLIEDAQWMDEASAHLLSRLAAATDGRDWSMVVTHRSDAGGFAPETGTIIDLGPLPPADAERFVDAATAAAPLRPHQVKSIVARAGGNPLFLEETLRIVRETGSVDALPDSLGAVVGTRIDALPPLPRRILQYASVLGRSFRTKTLRELIGREGLGLDAATRRELASFLEADGGSRLRFRHAMVRDVAYDGLSFRRRRQLHLEAAGVAEREAAGHVEDAADLLAMHYFLGGDHERAWHFSRIAGDSARDAYANVEAAASYEQALESARRLGTVPPGEQARVWIDLGDVRGPIGLFDGAIEAYRRASRLLGDDTIACADVHYKRALMRERAGAYSQALREVTVGYRLVEGNPTMEAAKARARLAVRRAFVRQVQERPAQALEVAARAVVEARAAGEVHAEGLASMVVHWAHLVLGQPGGAEYGERALQIFRDLDELESLYGVTNLLGVDAYWSGRWDEAIDYYTQGRDAATRAGNVVHAALIGSNIGEVLVNQGRLDEAEPMLRDAARVQRASGFVEGADLAEMYLGRLLSARGQHREAISLLERVRDELLEAGRAASAMEATIYLAQTLVRSGEPSGALALLAELRSGGDDFVMYAATLARVQGEALAAMGRGDEAIARTRHALAAADEQGLDYERALLLLQLAALEAPTNAAERKAEAAEILSRLGVRVDAVVTL